MSFGSMKPTSPGAADAEKRCLNSELWHACAGPLVCLPNVGTRVVYFPQGHSEQVAASTNKEVQGQIPNYPNLPAHLICLLHNVTMHVDSETDDVYAQMTLQPLSNDEQKESYVPIDMGVASKQPTNYFYKTLTASDTSTHGGFSVPRRAAEKVFPPLDFSQQPPAQELIARDLHDVDWKFKHIFRGQPKRHLLTTGWSVFVSAKRLIAGDSILFIWNENNQLLLGIRRANRLQTVMPSSVLSSDSMHIGLLAAAAHAAATNSRFTIFYNPRASPFEFVIPLTKYVKAVFHTRVSVGMRFRMLFETEESSVRRYMGTITDISDLDPVRWPNSQWRSVKVGWDESTAGERPPRISLWEIEPLTTFPMYPSFFPLRLKRPWHPGLPSGHDEGNAFTWMRGDNGDQGLQSLNFPSSGLGPLIQQRCGPSLMGNGYDQFHAMPAFTMQNLQGGDILKQQHSNYQQPLQFLHQASRSPSMLLQQVVEQAQPQQIGHVQSQGLLDNLHHGLNQQQISRPHAYEENFMIPDNPMQQHDSHVPAQLCEKLLFPDSSTNHSSDLTPFRVQNMLGSAYLEGTTATLTAGLGQKYAQNREPWEPTFPVPHTGHFRNSGPGSVTNTIGSGVSALPYTASFIQNSLYGCLGESLGESSGTLQNAGEVDPPTKTFVKVYKSGSVGRSLDISQFSNYEELREELGHMYGIEGQLEDPFRSGWQLLFVDREEDILLLGDDPWEQFVNSVWYIKILSPEDVQTMGKHGV